MGKQKTLLEYIKGMELWDWENVIEDKNKAHQTGRDVQIFGYDAFNRMSLKEQNAIISNYHWIYLREPVTT